MMEQKFVRRRQIPQRFNAEKNVSSRTHTRRSSNDNKMNFIALQGICLRLCPIPECVREKENFQTVGSASSFQCTRLVSIKRGRSQIAFCILILRPPSFVSPPSSTHCSLIRNSWWHSRPREFSRSILSVRNAVKTLLCGLTSRAVKLLKTFKGQ